MRTKIVTFVAIVSIVGCKAQGAKGNKKAASDAIVRSTKGGPVPGENAPKATEVLPNPDVSLGAHRIEVSCPLDTTPPTDKLVEEMHKLYEKELYNDVHHCADVVLERAPELISIQHLRASALAALGLMHEAERGFAMALALDPDDPETLVAAADFFINMVSIESKPSSTHLGLLYAKRGNLEASVRQSQNAPLRSRLALLEAQALNDLGQSDKALEAALLAHSYSKGSSESHHEIGMSLFALCRFREAEEALKEAVALNPNDAFAFHFLGLIHERYKDDEAAALYFESARKLSPVEFSKPWIVEEEEFDRELRRAISELDEQTKGTLATVAIEIEDRPSLDDLTAVSPPFAPTILGLFRGESLASDESTDAASGRSLQMIRSDQGGEHGSTLPRTIVLYRSNIMRAAHSRSELNKQIRRTLAHEIGHLKGLNEAQLKRLHLD